METLKSIWDFIATVGVALFLGFAFSVVSLPIHSFISAFNDKIEAFSSRDWFDMWIGATVASIVFVFYLVWR